MPDFSFGSDFKVVNDSKRRFTPWDIYSINKITVSENDFQGKNDPSKTYHTFRIRFENDEYYYDENLFFPESPTDTAFFEDRVFENSDGTKRKSPSRFTQSKVLIGQILKAVNPAAFAKFQTLAAKFKSFNDMAQVFAKLVNSTESIDTQLKLTGRNQQDGSVFACLPSFVGYSSDGRPYISNFIGDNLFFTSREEAKREIYKNAKPTQMPDMTVNDLTMTSSSSEDMKVDDIDNIDDILNSLK